MIDEEITYKEKGYRSTDLSRGSAKKVWAVCDTCGKERWVDFNQYRELCHGCSMQTEELRRKMSVSSKGRKHSEETRKKMSKSQIGRTHSDETREKLRVMNTGKNNPSYGKKPTEESRKKMSLSSRGEKNPFYGKKHTEESRKRMSESLKGKKAPEETRKKMSDVRKGKKASEETRKKLSIAKSGKNHPMYGKKHTEESRKKISISLSGENAPNWRGGLSFGKYCKKFNNSFKESVRDRFGRKCYMCEKSEDDCGRKLDVHHINYYKNCGCDDSIRCMFVALCARCHSKTNYDRELWERLLMNVLNYEEIDAYIF